MASPTVFMHLGAWSQLLPTVAALGRQSGVAAHRWIAAACFASALGDALMLLLALRGINNHWVGYTSTPLTGAMFLWALATWHVNLVERLTVRLIVPAYLLAWLISRCSPRIGPASAGSRCRSTLSCCWRPRSGPCCGAAWVRPSSRISAAIGSGSPADWPSTAPRR